MSARILVVDDDPAIRSTIAEALADDRTLDLGRFAVTGRDEDRGTFKTPSLRNVAMTAPYMHDGSVATLEEVIEHYDRGGASNPYLDEEIETLDLTPEEKKQLIAFLKSLTGEMPKPPGSADP